jgi:predicted AlkP superfamily phosphohydrolase/phosphomutase
LEILWNSRTLVRVVLLALFTAGCHGGKTPVEGLWLGSFSKQGQIGMLPDRITISGPATCVLLRHLNHDVTIEVEGTYSKQEPVSMDLAERNLRASVRNGRFSEVFQLSASELPNESWLRLRFAQPGVLLEKLHFAESRRYPKTLVFALDGATWRVMGKLVDENRLPNFQKLIRKGSYGELMSIERTLSPVVWTSIASGYPPERHRIVDFLDKRGRPVHSGQVNTKRIWDILSDKTPVTIGQIGWLVTWPVERISGFMLSDRVINTAMSESEKMLSIYPSEVRSKFEAIFEERRKNYIAECKRFTSLKLDPNFKNLDRNGLVFKKHRTLNHRLFPVYLQDSTYIKTGLELYSSLRPDVFFLYLRGLDYTQHSYWFYMRPEESLHPINKWDVKYFQDIVKNYYVYLDEQIGKFLEIAPRDATVLVLSDHGFRSYVIGKQNKRTSQAHHEREGVYIFSGNSFKQNHYENGVSVYDICPLLLYRYGLPVAKDMEGRVPLDLYNRFLPAPNPRLIAGYGTKALQDRHSIATGADEEIKEQLKTLGYISD